MLTDETTAFLSERHPGAAGLAVRVRDAVLRAEPDLEERVWHGWDGIGFHHPDAGYVCAIFPRADGTVRLLFEHGVRLPDPLGLLEGDGRQTRHLTLRGDGHDPSAEAVEQLLHDAVAERLLRI